MAKVKICGLQSEKDIQMVNELKPDYCGFVIDFPKSHRSKTPDEVRELVKGLDRTAVSAVGVFVNEDVNIVAELINDGTLDAAQLHGQEDDAYVRELKKRIGRAPELMGIRALEMAIMRKPGESYAKGKKIIQAFQVKNKEDIERALASSADLILLDQGQGSGSTFDWSILNGQEIPRKWILAGGLSEENLETAINRFQPWAVDLSSAVETDKKKDPEKVRRVIELVRKIEEEAL